MLIGSVNDLYVCCQYCFHSAICFLAESYFSALNCVPTLHSFNVHRF